MLATNQKNCCHSITDKYQKFFIKIFYLCFNLIISIHILSQPPRLKLAKLKSALNSDNSASWQL